MDHTIDNGTSAWAGFRRWFYIIAALLGLLLLLSWLMGYGPGGSACRVATPAVAVAPAAPAVTAPAVASPAAAPVVAAPAPLAEAAPKPAPEPAAALVPPAAKVYFALNKFDLPADTDSTLAEVVAFLKKNGDYKAHVSGFHDPSGSAAHNEALAHNRARAVRAALEKAGIVKDRVVMEKPQVTTGTGEPREARRVEVTVKKA